MSLEIPRNVKKEDGFPSAVPCWERAPDGHPAKAFIWCFNGHVASLADHTIAPDGIVNPSCVCPRCSWHEWVRLVGWASLFVFLFAINAMAAPQPMFAVWDALPGLTYRLYQADAAMPYRLILSTGAVGRVALMLDPGPHSFYLTALSGTNESLPGNVFVTPPISSAPAGATIKTNAPPPPPPTPATIFIEAEAGTLVAPMVSAVDATASGGRAVSSATRYDGSVTFSVNLAAGTWFLWCRIRSADSDSDSFYVEFDGALDVYRTTSIYDGLWQWTLLNGGNGGPTRTLTATAGQHTLIFRGRDPLTWLDCFYLTQNPNLVPP